MRTHPWLVERHQRSVFIADGARWERFPFRSDDVIVSTPSKCGTTWMQKIVGMLLLDRPDLGAPISSLSPWLDMLIAPTRRCSGSSSASDTVGSSRRTRRWTVFLVSHRSPTSR